eukprot:6190229-Pleurochrysis_carterae.AAC.2
MAHIQPEVPHGERERLLGHHGCCAAASLPEAHRLLSVGSGHQRGTSHAGQMKAIPIATTNGVSYTADCLWRMQTRHEQCKDMQLDRVLNLQPVTCDRLHGR